MISSRTASIHTECQRATTKEECETLARLLVLTDIIAGVTINLEMPPYCYYMPTDTDDKRLWFNTAVAENTTPCTNMRKCVCKNGVLTAGKIKQ